MGTAEKVLTDVLPTQAPPDPDENAADFTLSGPGPRTLSPDLALYAMIYALAKKYSNYRLKGLALRKFTDTAIRHWDSADFLKAAREAYTSTAEADRGLRDVTVTILYKHPELLDKKEAQFILQELSMLAYNLVMCIHTACAPLQNQFKEIKFLAKLIVFCVYSPGNPLLLM